MRKIYSFNHDWLFSDKKVDEDESLDSFVPVTVPHSNKIFPHHNFDDQEYQFVSTYRKQFELPEPLNGRRLFIDFDGAMTSSLVRFNGCEFEEYKGGFTPFSFDLTPYVKANGENNLLLHLDSTEREDIPPFGYVVDYMTFGGLYRDVWLRYVNPVYIKNCFVRPLTVLDKPGLEVQITVANTDSINHSVSFQLRRQQKATSIQDESISGSYQVDASQETVITLTFNDHHLLDTNLWSLEAPTLYELNIQMIEDEAILDDITETYGYRDVVFKDDGFYLNGELIHLIGLNRHQNYPYIGCAAPKRLQERDAEIVKFDLGCNLVRTSHYPQSTHFLNRCDEIGLLVFEEIPGWQHIGDEKWQEISIRDVTKMIERDRNHPSIIIWGVRINESQDAHDFYTKTNQLAHELDPSRQTGGVRFWQQSEFLEDVYTFNDFSDAVEKPVQTPHLITEFNGHMFPTKTWDGEERVVEHAIRHAKIQDQQIGMPGVSGAIGWCAFDYNTHKEFGSGDRICYHGVMDIFRLPKYAGDFYASQIDHKYRVVLSVASVWSMGDRSKGGNNPLVIFSNCDEIELSIGQKSMGRYAPDTDHYPHLPHAPFIIPLEMEWGQAFEDLTVKAYIGDNLVKTQKFPINSLPKKIKIWADHSKLNADNSDMTAISFIITDEYGNRLPYTQSILTFKLETDTDAELIGENPFAIMGGQGAIYLKSGFKSGKVRVIASSSLNLADVHVDILIQ